jgi:hypothetical protein
MKMHMGLGDSVSLPLGFREALKDGSTLLFDAIG